MCTHQALVLDAVVAGGVRDFIAGTQRVGGSEAEDVQAVVDGDDDDVLLAQRDPRSIEPRFVAAPALETAAEDPKDDREEVVVGLRRRCEDRIATSLLTRNRVDKAMQGFTFDSRSGA